MVDVISFTILILTATYVLPQYGHLPEEIPRHFNVAGEPDAWGGKGFLIGMLVLYGFMLFQAFILNYFLIMNQSSKEAMQFINIPFIKKETLTDEQLQLIKQNMARMLATINLFMSFIFSYLLYGMVQTAMGKANGLTPWFIFLIILSITAPIYYIWKSYRNTK